MADIIEELSGMDDAALAVKLGFSDKVKSFREDLARAAKLQGKPRAKIEDHLTRMFTPDTYRIDDMKWQLERAEQKAAGKTTPCEIVETCGDCG